jgi:hypothetical protein
MPGAIEASTALYLYGTEPSMTAISGRRAQRREQLVTRELLRRLHLQAHVITQDIADTDRTEQTAASNLSSADRGVTSAEAVLTALPKTQADRTVAQLFELGALDADWDGNEAAKPLAFSLDDARDFIRALAPESVIPRPALHADGHAILFLRGPDVYAEIEFLGKKRISFYARRGGQEWSDEIDFDGRTLPPGLSEIGLAI